MKYKTPKSDHIYIFYGFKFNLGAIYNYKLNSFKFIGKELSGDQASAVLGNSLRVVAWLLHFLPQQYDFF